MQKLQTYFNNYEIPSCTICMEEMLDNLGTTPCGHVFHVKW